MAKANFEYEGDVGILSIVTHFGISKKIECQKNPDETFRLGGTAINEVMTHEGLVLDFNCGKFRAFRSVDSYFESNGTLSDESWDNSDRHCWVTEYYNTHMEGNSPGWFISKEPISHANHLFVNLDILDGGGNVVKRYRVSPFTGEYRVMEGLSG